MAKPSIYSRKSKTASFSDVVKEDKQYLRGMRQLERIMANVDVKMLISELFSLQTTRAVNVLKGRKVIQSALRSIVDSSVDEIATRSRCTTIKMSSLQALIEVEEITSHLSKYFLSKYVARMRAEGFTTITAQRSQIDVYLRPFIETKKNLEYVQKMADLVTADVDAAGWGLKRISDAIDSAKKDR